MATQTRTTEDVVLRGFDALNDRDREAFVDLHAEDAVIEVFGEEIRGIDAIVENQFGLFESFPDLTYEPDVVLAEDDTVVARWIATGTNDGAFEGIEPTGAAVEFSVMGTFRVEDGRISSVRLLVDQLGLLGQLGVSPGDADEATTDTNEELVRRAFDALNDRDREAFLDLHADDTVLHAWGEDVRGIDAIADLEFDFFESFPDLTLTLDEMIAERDAVAARWTVTGTHDGEYEGIEPTGAAIEFTNMGTFRFEDGTVTEVWLVGDQLGLLEQIGAVEPPTGGPDGTPSEPRRNEER